jgi:hypothetical protein
LFQLNYVNSFLPYAFKVVGPQMNQESLPLSRPLFYCSPLELLTSRGVGETPMEVGYTEGKLPAPTLVPSFSPTSTSVHIVS